MTAAAYVERRFTKGEVEYMVLEIDDSPMEDIRVHFERVIAFIQKNRETNVLVHCISGISRSGACVIAYVMKT